jgi:hypothetical protein
MIIKAISKLLVLTCLVIIAPFLYLFMILIRGIYLVLIMVRDLADNLAKAIRSFRDYLLSKLEDN